MQNSESPDDTYYTDIYVQRSPLVERRQIGSWQKNLKVARSYDKLVHHLKYIYTFYGTPPFWSTSKAGTAVRVVKWNLF